MVRRSQRLNKGQPPSHLEDFVTGNSSDESDKSEDLDSTVREMEKDDSMMLSLLEKLTNQLESMQTKMEEKNSDLNQRLEATNLQLANIQQTVNVKNSNESNRAGTSFAVNGGEPLRMPAPLEKPTSLNSSDTSTMTPTQPLLDSTPGLSAGGNNFYPGYLQQYPSIPIRKQLVALPKFDGNPCDWLIFSAEYKRTTTEFKYSSPENTSRLNDSLKGKARELVQWLLIHDEMADKIMERLCSRFGRPEFLVDAQINMLKDIPEICDNNMEQIVPFADRVINFSHFMLSCSSQHQLANPTLLTELVLKLPMSMRIAWATHISSMSGVPSILDFSNWIEIIADNIARVPVCSASISKIDKKSSSSTSTSSKKGQTLHTSKPATPIICVECGEDHFIAKCPIFLQKPVDDKWIFVREKRLCFSCLRYGHSTRACTRKKNCNKDGCTRVHHTQLHNGGQAVSKPSTTISNIEISCHAASSKENELKVWFKVVPVKLYNGGEVVSTYALIDEGSSVSLINKSLAERLKLKGTQRKLNLQWFGNHSSSEESQSVRFEISGVHATAEVFEMNNVSTVNNLCLPLQTLHMDELHSKYIYLRNLPIASYTDARPELLIGLDFCHLGVSRRKIRHASDGPIVAESPLGWIVYGRAADDESQSNTVRMYHASGSFEELNSIVKDYFTTENFGVQQVSELRESSTILRARQLLQSTTKKVGKRYESGLLWKADDMILPDSYAMAVSRLKNVEIKMKKDPVYSTKYRETIVSYIQKGYARKLLPEEVAEIKPRIWYLPHFGVLNPNKPGKFRLVFDAAAKVGETSLNSSLLTGPDLNQSLLTVLSKFREGQFGVCGDIKEMFHQVLIRQEDQDSQRFLWRNQETGEIEVYKMLVMIFGSTSSPTTAQYVKNIHATQYLDRHQEAAKAIIERHYVDDYVNSFNSVDEAIAVSMMVKDIEMDGGFDLRGFISNSKEVACVLNQGKSDQPDQVNMDLDKISTCDKILGMVWDTSTDEFKFNLKFHRIEQTVLDCEKAPTKREFLAIVMSVYDPFGFLADFLVYMKVLLQLVWRSGVDWDQQIPAHLHERWCSWQQELSKVSQFRIPRCYSKGLWTAKTVELHIFVDSSEVAFSAVCYLRVTSEEDIITVSFIIGKTKCAPVKYLSIPRLELQAAVLGVRLYQTVLKSHSFVISKATFWSDSKTVLHWIKDDRRRYKSFVANRIGEILDSTEPIQWNWVSTHENAADDATRDVYPPQFKLTRRWIDGPQWLMQDEIDWPHQTCCLEANDEDVELQPTKHRFLMIRENMIQFDFANSSSYFKVLRTAGWIFRFVTNLKAKVSNMNTRSGELTVEEISKAETLICRMVQLEAFQEEYHSLSRNLPISKQSDIYQLTPTLDESGVIRLNGRIDNAPTLTMKTKRPIILPKQHLITKLIVNHYHRVCRHQNEGTIICEIRKRFWINDLRVLVRSVKRQCQHCKNESVKPVTPQMGQLPSSLNTLHPTFYLHRTGLFRANLCINWQKEGKTVDRTFHLFNYSCCTLGDSTRLIHRCVYYVPSQLCEFERNANQNPFR